MTASLSSPAPARPAASGEAWALLRHPLPWLFLLALAVRLADLTYHSLWFDEVMSTYWAARPAPEIWRVGLALGQDKHPPLYYLMLHAWTSLFGGGDWAVRSLGALIGALAVLPAYGIGRRLGGRPTAVLGSLLLAVNPFLVWYSQEARMFMPATTFALVGLLGVLWIAGDGQPALQASAGSPANGRSLPGFVLTVAGFTAALYTYLFSAFLLPVAALWVAMLWWDGRHRPDHWRKLAWGLAALAVINLLFLPLARAAWLVSGAESEPGRPFEGMTASLGHLLQVYSIGWPSWAAHTAPWLAMVMLPLALAGIATRRPAALRHGGLYLAVWLGVPVLIGGLLLARDRTIFAEARYFIILVPALCLAWARALAALWSWREPAGALGLAVVLGLTLVALPANWSPERRREAWREAAAYATQHAGPSDAMLIHADYVHVAFDRYFDGPQAVFFPFTDTLVDGTEVATTLQGLVDAGFNGIWLVQSHDEDLDPDGLITGWLGANFPLITEQFPAGIAIRGYATRYRTTGLPSGLPLLDPHPLQGLRLLACQHSPGPVASRDDLFHPPSGWVHVTTYWTVDEPVGKDLFPQVQMVDGAGQVWGERLERSGDAIHIWPTSAWVPGEVVRVDYDVNLNPLTPRGTYRLVVGLDGEQATCGEVAVQ